MSDTPATPVTPKKTRTEIQRASKQRWYIKHKEDLKARASARYYANHEVLREQSKLRARITKARLIELEALVARTQNVPQI